FPLDHPLAAVRRSIPTPSSTSSTLAPTFSLKNAIELAKEILVAKSDGGLDWSTLAAGQQTLVFYMGLTQAAEIQHQLIAHGMPASTPVALVENGTSCRQRVIEGELSHLGTLALQAARPSLIIVGSVVSLRNKLNWFSSRVPQPQLAQMA
ncbi:MAG: hypothetical protein HYZ77_10615, partial [Serratia liquefaciens]|nr:hypothetical protein [Serratia liquefaciens]